jgi:hypothetical protein
VAASFLSYALHPAEELYYDSSPLDYYYVYLMCCYVTRSCDGSCRSCLSTCCGDEAASTMQLNNPEKHRWREREKRNGEKETDDSVKSKFSNSERV